MLVPADETADSSLKSIPQRVNANASKQTLLKAIHASLADLTDRSL